MARVYRQFCPICITLAEAKASAANAALNAFNKKLLASHIKSCVLNDIKNGNDEIIDELAATCEKLMK